MIHFLALHWKAEAAISAVVIAAGVFLHDAFVLIAAAAWDEQVILRMIISALVSAAVGYFVWWKQQRIMDGRSLVQKEKETALQRAVEHERSEKARIQKGHEALVDEVASLRRDFNTANEKLSVMNQTVVPMYEAMKQKMIQILTHPHAEFKVPDDLLAVVSDPKGHLTPPQMAKLETLLKEREHDTHPDVTPEERLAARALPVIIKLAAIEEQATDPVVSVQLVSTTVPNGPAKPKPDPAA